MSSGYFRYPLLVLLWVVALMSGAFSLFREVYGIYSGAVPPRSLFWSCAWAAFVVSAAALWVLEHKKKLEAERKGKEGVPSLSLNIENAIWTFDEAANQTNFILAAFLLNTGAPSIAMSWSATYKFGDVLENMVGFYLRADGYRINFGDQELFLTNENLLMPQVLTRRLERGEGKLGRVVFSVPGNRGEQIATHQFVITVTCHDFLGNACSTAYKPSGIPLPNVMMFPGEKLSKKG